MALVHGNDLNPWHERREWREKTAVRKAGLVTSFSNLKVAAYRMARTAWGTTQHSNGQEELRWSKNKDFSFPNEEELQLYIEELYHMQEGLCALTGIPMQLDRAQDDDEQLCSLDRIDSDGHYAPGNLLIVCRFANRWKSHSNNANFMRLINLIKSNANL
ncbi:hypothetical protein [Pseudomonas sp. SWRI92]|uniref:hypothetical protein n=1 Tax=Pseudomonas sp. SWRI92 TaxID=2745499 RepID=UPI00192DE6B7|nr:hypothetical protein [Pseudomonas sp. SWRI92]